MKSRNKGITLSYLNTILNMACGLFLSSYLLRLLGDIEYGIYQSISSFANYLVLLEFGVGTVMTRNISMARANGDEAEIDSHVSTLWTITLVLTGIILIAATIFYLSIDRLYGNTMTYDQIQYAKTIFIFVVLHLVFSFFIQTLNGIAMGYEDYSYCARLSIVRVIVRTVLLAVFIYFLRFSVVIAVVDTAIYFGILVYSFLFCRKHFHVSLRTCRFDMSIFKNAFPLCFAIFLQGIINQANSNVDKFIIGIKLSPQMVSLYAVALFIYTVFSSLTTVPITMYAPQVSKNMSLGMNGKNLLKSLVPAVRLTSIIGGSILFGFIAVGRQFITVFYGADYINAWLIAVLLMVAAYPNMLTGVLINVLNVYNKRLVRSGILMTTTILNVVFTVIWIDKWGIMGAVWATFAATLVGNVIIMGIYYTRYLQLSVLYLYGESQRGVIVPQIIAAAIAWVLGTKIQNTLVSFILCGFVFVLILGIGYVLIDKVIRNKFFCILKKFGRE